MKKNSQITAKWHNWRHKVSNTNKHYTSTIGLSIVMKLVTYIVLLTSIIKYKFINIQFYA